MRDDRGAAARSPLLLALASLLTLSACEWFSDFKDQPRVEPWEAEFAVVDSAGRFVMSEAVPFRGNPQGSVPIDGLAMPGFIVSYSRSPATIDSMAGLANPRPMSAASLENGRKYYQINCAVCHGAGGAGNGPAVRYGVAAPTLLGAVTRARTDGYIWGVIRNGRGLMPTYNRIEEGDRWDVVNYVRALQGVGGAPADTSPAGYPGQNGPQVPGPSRLAPTRPVPFAAPSAAAMPGATAVPDSLSPAAAPAGAHE
ncbi:MAG TPA: cytochrome c [Gemmatimonadaceae bacterium]|nr:cytochrome c [Gemmatimonadaceae bacterium]